VPQLFAERRLAPILQSMLAANGMAVTFDVPKPADRDRHLRRARGRVRGAPAHRGRRLYL